MMIIIEQKERDMEIRQKQTEKNARKEKNG